MPIGIFCIVKLLTSEWTDAAKDKLDSVGRWGSVASLIIFCFALESQVSSVIASDPDRVIEYLLVAVAAIIVIGGITPDSSGTLRITCGNDRYNPY